MKERQPNDRRLLDLENFLFSLQRLEEEGKKTGVLQEQVWKEIKEIIEEGADNNARNPNCRSVGK